MHLEGKSSRVDAMNMHMADKLPPVPVYAGPASCGRGLFARKRIASGEQILEFQGRPFSFAESPDAPDSVVEHLLQLGEDNYLLCEEPGRYVNHGCDPNAGIVNNTRLIALRDIEPGEEIRMDYSTTIADDWEMICRCEGSSCRGNVGNFRDLPADLQERYLKMGIVQKFIADKT